MAVSFELIFGIQIQLFLVSPKLIPEISPPACRGWLSPHRSVFGRTIASTTQMFVADSGFRLGNSRWPCGTKLSAVSLPRVLWPSSFSESSTDVTLHAECLMSREMQVGFICTTCWNRLSLGTSSRLVPDLDPHGLQNVLSQRLSWSARLKISSTCS